MKKRIKSKNRFVEIIPLIWESNKLTLLFFLGFAIVFVVEVFTSIRDNQRLELDGVFIKGVVTEQRGPGYRGIINTYSKFNIHGHNYDGWSDVDDDKKVGDSIEVLYWKDDPNLNKSKSMME